MTPTPTARQITKAEDALVALVQDRLPRAPGSLGLRKAREAALKEFETHGLPHRRIEEWKFTDVRSLLKDLAPSSPASDAKAVAQSILKSHQVPKALAFVFVDGRLALAPPKLPQGLSFDSTALRLEPEPGLLTQPLPETADAGAASLNALNVALAADGFVVRIAPGSKLTEPLQIIFATAGTIATRNRVDVGAGAQATLIETHVARSRAQAFATTSITVGDGARLDHITDHGQAEGDFTFSHALASLGDGATYRPFVFHIGTGATRHQTTLTFKGERATFDFGGASLVAGRGHVDTTLVIDHAVPGCVSREAFKTVLSDHGRAIFQGKVIVRPDAQKTDGKQMAQALMLSPTAEFDAKPELEIYADDVVCGHGATSAEIDPDHLFYLRSRGIPESEAKALLIEGFLAELFDRIEHETLRDALAARAVTWLRGQQPPQKA
jgi:Fe-S cluster assembly protein SufD